MIIKENDIHNELRRLLDRWYSAETSPAEEERLQALFKTAGKLPRSLEGDRKLFLGLSGVDTEDVSLSPAVEARINSAVEAEMRLSSASVRKGLWRRRVIWVAAGIALCLSGSLAVMKLLSEPTVNVNQELVADNRTTDPASEDAGCLGEVSLPSPGPESVSEVKEAPETASTTGGKGKARGKSRNHNIADEEIPLPADLASVPASPENYRIVGNPAEAEEILGSIFSRLESTIKREQLRLASMRLDYDSEMAKVSELERINDYEHIAI